MHGEKHFYFKMLITFEPKVAQRSVASQNDHKSKACVPEAYDAAFTMYRRLFFWHLNSSNWDSGVPGVPGVHSELHWGPRGVLEIVTPEPEVSRLIL